MYLVCNLISLSLCSTSHTTDGVTSLPDYSAAASGDNNHENGDTTDEPTAKKQRVNCDKCKGDAKAAECYCVDCDRKLCQRHEEVMADNGIYGLKIINEQSWAQTNQYTWIC